MIKRHRKELLFFVLLLAAVLGWLLLIRPHGATRVSALTAATWNTAIRSA